MRVAFRADASPVIGSGHVMRSLTLAAALRAQGAQAFFVVRERFGDMREVIAQAGFTAHTLRGDEGPGDPWLATSYDTEIAESFALLQSLEPLDLVVADHYGLDVRWEVQMRKAARGIVVIDDLANRPHDCDLLVDQNLGADAKGRYDGLVPNHALRLLGPRYALLREEFRPYAQRIRLRDGTITRVLVAMGGFDRENETRKVLDALDACPDKPLGVSVVLPERAPHASAIASHCERSGYRYFGRVDGIAKLMDEADLAIGAVGATSLERCIVGLPAIVVTLAENQRAGAQAGERAGVALWLGDASDVNEASYRRALLSLRHDPARVAEMSKHARDAVAAPDERFSMDRVVEAIQMVAA